VNITFTDMSDDSLVRLSLDRDEAAYGELIRRWERAVISAAYHITADPHTSEDIAQESFFACWFKLHMLKEYEKFGAWICRVAKNLAINFVTRHKKDYSLDAIMTVQSKGSSPERLLIESETQSLIRGAFQTLSDKLRQPAERYYLHAQSQKKIASDLNLPEGTVKRRLFDARTVLRAELAKVGITDMTTTFRKERKGNIMTQNFVKSVQDKIQNLDEYATNWESWWYERNNGSKNAQLTELIDLQKAIDEMADSAEKADATMKAYYYQTFFDPSDEAFERALNMACERNDIQMVINLTIEFFQISTVRSEKLLTRIERVLPLLENEADANTYGQAIYWCAKQYLDMSKNDEAIKFFKKSMDIFGENNVMYSAAIAAIRGIELSEKYGYGSDDSGKCVLIEKISDGMTIEKSNGKTRMKSQPGFSFTQTFAPDEIAIPTLLHKADVICNASSGGGYIHFTDNMKIGDKIVFEDDREFLEMASQSETVTIGIGTYENCTKMIKSSLESTAEIYYCPQVGIVKADFYPTKKIFIHQFGEESELVNMDENYELDEHTIVGGSGLLPLAKGNKWSYKRTNVPASVAQHIEYVINAKNGNEAHFSTSIFIAQIAD